MTEVLFVCDSGAEIGGGHVMRSLTLAGALREQGVRSTFLATPAAAVLLDRFDRIGCGRAPTPQPERAEDLATAAEQALEGGRFTGVVVDHYGWSAALEERLRGGGRTLLVLDDLADRPHAADILLDSSFGRDASDYDGLVPAHAQRLIGPRYALVRPEFAAAGANRARGATEVRRVLVSLGLTDLDGITGRVVDALEPVRGDIAFDVVLGSRAPSLAGLRERAARDPQVRVHVDTTEMAELMVDADLAVGAGGSTTWERAALGLPTLTLVLAPNQEALAARLEAAGATIVVDAREAGFEARLREAWSRLVADAELRAGLSKRAGALCDGGGAGRVAAAFAAALRGLEAAGELLIRAAEAADAEDVWRWRNDAESRAASRQTDAVTWEAHQAWFAQALQDPRRTFLIGVDASGAKVGLVRLDQLPDGRRLVGVNLAPEQRGRGHGRRLLSAALRRAGEADRLVAEVREENARSLHLFEQLGFKRRASADGFVTFEREPQGRGGGNPLAG